MLPSSSIKSIVLSSDGQRIFFGCGDGIIRILNTASGELVARLRGHNGTVNALAISSDCSVLFSGGKDKTLRQGRIVRN